MAILIFKKLTRAFRSDRHCFNVTKPTRYFVRYNIFVKRRHKILEFLGTMTILHSKDMLFQLNYVKCFYWVGRLTLDKSSTQFLFDHDISR